MVFRTPAFLPWMFSSLTWRIQTQEKKIYLTFDDGPVPGPTEAVLDLLKKYNARATFFCIGDNVRRHPHIFSKIIEDGHTIGNHTFHHLKGWNTPTARYLENIKQCEAQFGMSAPSRKLFRPPYGRITPAQVKALNDYTIIMWDVLTQDYSAALRPEKCLQASVRATRPGSIVVFHDSLKAEKNLMYVLPRYLDYFSAEGFSFESL